MIQSPFITRAAHDLMQASLRVQLDARDQRIRDLEADNLAANNRAADAQTAALRVIGEARGAITEAVGIAKVAAHALFSVPEGEDTVTAGLSVGEADRARARLERERLEPRGRRG